MDFTNLVLDIFDAIKKIYSIVLQKPFLTIQVQYTPQKDGSGKVTREMFAFTIANDSGPDTEILRVWFLTSFNRPVSSEFIDSKLPVNILKRNRVSYFVPMADLKHTLNKKVDDTIYKAVVLDKTGHQFTGRVDKIARDEFAR